MAPDDRALGDRRTLRPVHIRVRHPNSLPVLDLSRLRRSGFGLAG
jgi:hypothetical protein